MKDKVLIGLLILISFISILFFGSRKMEYNVDEIWTYGLSNNIGSINPDFEYGKEYSGWGFYKDFMQVQAGHGFNYVNVLNNQANDVHPPLYYFFVHTVCSIFKDSYSMWYGIAVNILWMVPTIILLYWFIKDLTGDTLKTFGFVLVYISNIIVMDTFILIRMYTQFVFFAIAISYLVKKYWNNKLDRKFYILYSVIMLLGLLTHYYFLIFVFFISATFGVHLIIEKRLPELGKCVITAAADGIVYLLLWHHILNHIFRGGRGHQALNSAFSVSGIVTGLIIFVVCFVVFKRGKEKYSYITALILTGLFYLLVVLRIAPFFSLRYISPVVFIGVFAVFMLLARLIGKKADDIRSTRITIAALLFFNIGIFVLSGFTVPDDFYSEETIELYDQLEGKKCIVYIDEDWEAINYFVPLQKAGSYMFINSENLDLLDGVKKGDIVSTPGDYDEIIEKRISAKPIHSENSSIHYYEVL